LAAVQREVTAVQSRFNFIWCWACGRKRLSVAIIGKKSGAGHVGGNDSVWQLLVKSLVLGMWAETTQCGNYW